MSKVSEQVFRSIKFSFPCLRYFKIAFLSSISLWFSSKSFAVESRLKIGVVRPMSGPMEGIGEELNNGIQIAYEKILQSKDKSLAKAIKIYQEDDQGKSSGAKDAADKLIKDKRVHVLIGSVSNTINDSISDIAARRKKLLILPIATDPSLTGKASNIFSVSISKSQQGAILGKFARSVLNKNNALILEEQDNPYAQDLGANFANMFKKHGGEKAMREQYDSSPSGFDAIANRSVQKFHDVAFVPAFYPQARELVSKLKAKNRQVVYVGSDGWDTYEMAKAFGPGFSGHYYYPPYAVDDPHPALQKFVDTYKEKYNKTPSLAAFAGYEALNLVVFAYRKVKSNRTAPLSSFLRKAKKLPSLSGPIRMSSSRSPLKPATIMVTTPEGSKYMTKVNL